MWGFAAAIQNGVDAQGDDLSFAGRVQVTPMGTPAMHEGGLGATGDPTLTVGVGFYQDDDSIVDDRAAVAVDGSFNVGIFSVMAEVVDYDKGVLTGTTTPAFGLFVPGDIINDATPWSIAFGVMAIPDRLEFGVRYEDLDDPEDTTVVTVGANYYLQGHGAKWQANYSSADSDDTLRDGSVFQGGLLVSI
jgi:hypothetical protein